MLVVPPNAERRRASFGTDCFRLDSDPRKVPANLLRERRIRFDCDNLSAELTESFRVVTSMSADIKDQRAATNERSEQAAEPQTFAEVATVKGTLVRVASWPVETSADVHAAQPKTLRAGRQGSHTAGRLRRLALLLWGTLVAIKSAEPQKARCLVTVNV